MKLSVIIPVFNAARFVGQAVRSALDQEAVGEVVLVEDNSTDNSLEICAQLSRDHENVRLIRHADGRNHGAGATRNLGLRRAENDYVAFLDADDFYLPDRFETPIKLLARNPDIDGVYEAVGIHFYNGVPRDGGSHNGPKALTTVVEGLQPEELFAGLVRAAKGSLHLDGLTVSKQLIHRCGYFPENLRLHQDSNLIIQLAACGQMIGGRLTTPVAMRGIHDANRFFNNRNVVQTKLKARRTLFYWGVAKGLAAEKLSALYYNYLLYLYMAARPGGSPPTARIGHVAALFREILTHWRLSLMLRAEHRSRLREQTQNGRTP